MGTTAAAGGGGGGGGGATYHEWLANKSLPTLAAARAAKLTARFAATGALPPLASDRPTGSTTALSLGAAYQRTENNKAPPTTSANKRLELAGAETGAGRDFMTTLTGWTSQRQ